MGIVARGALQSACALAVARRLRQADRLEPHDLRVAGVDSHIGHHGRGPVAFTAKHGLNERFIEVRYCGYLMLGLTSANGLDMLLARAMAPLAGHIANQGCGVEMTGPLVRS